jgi:hypothetical protein
MLGKMNHRNQKIWPGPKSNEIAEEESDEPDKY